MAFADWSTNPANNTLVGSINWSEGQLPSTVNDSARNMMSDLATWRDYLLGSGSPFAYLTGATFTGTVQVKNGANGYIALVPSANTETGRVYFYGSDTVRRGYITVLSSGVLTYGSDTGLGHNFLGGTVSRAGNVIWDAGNDGAGSGLDADLLDGQQGSYYSNITARLGYTPANIAGDIFTGTIRVRSSSNGFVELVPSAGGDTGAIYFSGNDGSRKGYIYAPASSIVTYGNDSGTGHRFLGGVLTRDGNTVWDAGNDGAGSGLDADLLDGLQGSAYDRHTSENLAQNGGYIVHANGLKECWGIVTVPANSEVTVTLPVSHTSWVNPVVTAAGPRFDYGGLDIIGLATILSANSFVITSGIGASQQFTWHSKGV